MVVKHQGKQIAFFYLGDKKANICTSGEQNCNNIINSTYEINLNYNIKELLFNGYINTIIYIYIYIYICNH